MTFLNMKTDGPKAKIELYGIIGRWMDIDERTFGEQLKAIGDKDIDIFINSDGGSVFTALTIHQMLARHKGNITITVDGIAASAATIITSIPNGKVIMPPGSMMMIHSPLLWPDQSNAEELRRLADVLDKVGAGIIDIYKNKTGLDDEKLQQIMSDDTYLTALESVDLGFADELGQQMDVAAQLSRDKMIVNGLPLDIKRHQKMPESWFTNQDNGQKPSGAPAGDNPEDKETGSMDLVKLKADHPELYASVLAEGEQAGIKAERDRIKAIEEMAMPGQEALIAKAKFDTGVTPEALAVDLVKAEKARKAQFLADRQQDGNLGDLGDQNLDTDDLGGDPEQIKANEQRAKWRGAAKAVASSRTTKSIFGKGK